MSEKINDGGPAFARPYFENANGTEWSKPQDGMSLRDWFAGQVLPAMERHLAGLSGHDIAAHCYMVADCMIKARHSKGGQND